MTKTERRWGVFKDYYKDGDHLTDHWVVIYGSEAEAEAAMAGLENGQDKSWYDPSDEDAAAVLYVEEFDCQFSS